MKDGRGMARQKPPTTYILRKQIQPTLKMTERLQNRPSIAGEEEKTTLRGGKVAEPQLIRTQALPHLSP